MSDKKFNNSGEEEGGSNKIGSGGRKIFTTQKMKFSIIDFLSKCDKIRIFPADLVTFTEEILNEKLHFLCSV